MHGMRMMRAGAAMMIVSAGVGTAAAAAAGDTAITVYPDGAAVVAESRQVPLQAGTQTVRLSGFPEGLRPKTLWLSGEGVTLVDSSYRAAADGHGDLLRAREGETVTLLRDDGSGGDVSREATLLSAGNEPVVRVDGRVEWLDKASPWRIALGTVPDSAGLDNGLALQLAAANSGRQSLDLIYQTSGLDWSAAYVGRLDTQDQTLSLRGQAALANQTGTVWRDVDMALVAGEVNRASGGPRPMAMRAESRTSADAGMQAESAGDYYRYTLDEPVTLARGEQRNVTLFEQQTIDVERRYRLEDSWGRGADGGQRAHAAIRIRLTNDLGKPLPGGTVRVYGTDRPPMLLGEARIPNTPVDGEVTMTLGQAFDITAERTTTDTARDGEAREKARRITLHNAKDESAEVRVVERVPGDWEMLSASADHERVDANRVAWTLSVPAGGSTKLDYRVRYR